MGLRWSQLMGMYFLTIIACMLVTEWRSRHRDYANYKSNYPILVLIEIKNNYEVLRLR